MREGWDQIPLGKICEKTSNIKWQDHLDESYEYIDLSSVSRESLSIMETTSINSENAPSRAKKIVFKNDVIFATTRPTLKRVTIISERYHNHICSTGYTVLRQNIKLVEARFIYYFIQTEGFMKRMESLQRGASYPAISDKDVMETLLWLPKSLPEQKQIVTILDQAFEAIDQAKANIEKNIENAKELFQSKLNEIFSRKGDGWEEKTLGEIGQTQTGTTPPTNDKSNYGDFISFVKPAHFQKDGSIVAGKSMLSKTGLEKGRLFDKNSVLMVCIGATIGKTGFTEIPVSSNQQINALTPLKNYEPKLLYYGLISPYVQNQVMQVGKSAQATLPIINKTKWEKLKVNIPLDKKKQLTIVKILDELNSSSMEMAKVYLSKLKSLEELKKSILQKAFSGELMGKELAIEAE